MRKMVKFASLCLAATLSMTTVLTAVPQNVRTVMAEDDETDNRQGGSESFEGDAKTLHYAYDASTKKLTLTGSFKGGDVFELLDDYIIFEKTEIDDIYADFRWIVVTLHLKQEWNVIYKENQAMIVKFI